MKTLFLPFSNYLQDLVKFIRKFVINVKKYAKKAEMFVVNRMLQNYTRKMYCKRKYKRLKNATKTWFYKNPKIG